MRVFEIPSNSKKNGFLQIGIDYSFDLQVFTLSVFEKVTDQ